MKIAIEDRKGTMCYDLLDKRQQVKGEERTGVWKELSVFDGGN